MFFPEDHTFVVCAYKENPYLEETIRSLQNQTVPSTVLISTSTPNAHISEMAAKCDVPVVINPHPHLAGDDWNYGYNAAETKLVTVAHQDDHYEPEFLSKVLQYANSYDNPEEISILFTDYYEMRGDTNVEKNALLSIKRIMNTPFKHPALNGSKMVKRRVLGFGNPICCPAITIVKSHVGPSVFDTTFKDSCDYKTLVDLANSDGRFVYIPEKLMGHRIYEESATSRNLQEGIRKTEGQQILEELWPKPIAKAINSVYSLAEKSNDL